MTTAAFVETVRTKGDRSDAIDLVYTTIDERLRAADWAFVDAVLDAVPLDLPLAVLLSFVTITSLAEEHVQYAAFYARVRAHLERSVPNRVASLLSGLEPTP